jgi:hypothetical protein
MIAQLDAIIKSYVFRQSNNKVLYSMMKIISPAYVDHCLLLSEEKKQVFGNQIVR